MGKISNIRVMDFDEIGDVSDTFKSKMKEMGLYPFYKDGKVKWGNMAQISFLQSLDTESGKKILRSVDKHSLPPSMRKQKRGFIRTLKKIPAQYIVLSILSILFGVVLVIMRLV
ncbi:MAG: hypothetical protein JXR56_00200 [Candidatus Cloacimonetes bacterium]|nr:hypothetical protein [Candidatus Cloacimonadota bacterium]